MSSLEAMGWARFAFQSTVSGLSFLILLQGVKELRAAPLSLRVLFEACSGPKEKSCRQKWRESLDDIIGIEISNEATECSFTLSISHFSQRVSRRFECKYSEATLPELVFNVLFLVLLKKKPAVSC